MRYYTIMIRFFLFFFILLWAPPVLATTSCPSGMMLAGLGESPISDCTCIGGQRPRMIIASEEDSTVIFGSCPNTKTFFPAPTMANNIGAIPTGDIQSFSVVQTGTYTIEAWGAQGGQTGANTMGGKGARARGEFFLDAGDDLRIFVGQQGENDPFGRYAGGGGASFVLKLPAGASGSSERTPLIVAGGGGGAGSSTGKYGLDASAPGQGRNGSGSSAGGGYSDNTPSASSGGNGVDKGICSSSTCGYGGIRSGCSTDGGDGGFGGGGASICNQSPGSGGGYSGGNSSNPGSGGTSYIDSDAINPSSAADIQIGSGKVIISW